MSEASQPILAVTDLHKSYDDNAILKGVSLRVEEGDLVSIIGLPFVRLARYTEEKLAVDRRKPGQRPGMFAFGRHRPAAG